jgi:hypothetical protein
MQGRAFEARSEPMPTKPKKNEPVREKTGKKEVKQ